MHHSHTKRLATNLGPFVVVPLDGDFAWEVLKKLASSALRKMTSFFPGAQTSDPCRGFEPFPPTPHSTYAPGWRFRVGGPRKMGFFGSSEYDLVPSRASIERRLSRIRALPPTPPLRAFSCYAPGWRFRVGGPRKMGLRAETNLYWKRNAFFFTFGHVLI